MIYRLRCTVFFLKQLKNDKISFKTFFFQPCSIESFNNTHPKHAFHSHPICKRSFDAREGILYYFFFSFSYSLSNRQDSKCLAVVDTFTLSCYGTKVNGTKCSRFRWLPLAPLFFYQYHLLFYFFYWYSALALLSVPLLIHIHIWNSNILSAGAIHLYCFR